MEFSFEKNKILGGICADEEYWKGLELNQFRLPQCGGCSRWMWPAHFRCGKCGFWGMEWRDLEPVGTVFSWTRSWYVFDRVKERAVPYVTVVAEIPAAAKVRVMGVLKGDETNLRIGAAVRGEIDPPSDMTKGYASIRWVLQ